MQCEPLHISLQFAFVLVGDRPLDCLAEARRPVVTTCLPEHAAERHILGFVWRPAPGDAAG